MRGIDVDKLEAIAEGASLAYQGEYVHIAERQLELQPNYLAHRNFDAQHCRNAGFADVDRVPAHHCGISRIYTNFDVERKPWMTPKIYGRIRALVSELRSKVQSCFHQAYSMRGLRISEGRELCAVANTRVLMEKIGGFSPNL